MISKRFFVNSKDRITKIIAVLGIFLSAFFFILTIKNSGLSFNELKLNTQHILGICISIASYSFVNYIQSYKAKLFWDKRPLHTYASVLIGKFYNSILPNQTGEFIRAWHFHNKNIIKFSDVISTMFLEKYIDAILSTVAIALFIIVTPPLHNSISAYIFTVLTIIIIASILFIIALYNGILIKFLIKKLSPFKSWSKYLYRFYLYLRYHVKRLISTKKILKLSFLSYLMLLGSMVQSMALLWATEICDYSHYILLSLFIAYMISIIAIIPSAPSGIGVLHYGIFLSLHAYFLSNDLNIQDDTLQRFALFAIFFHLSQLIPDLIIGAFVTLKEWKYITRLK